MANKTISTYLFKMIKDEGYRKQKYAFLKECESTKFAKLWEILFEIDVSDVETLENHIYEFGSRIKEDDYVGREIFICLVAFLNLVIK